MPIMLIMLGFATGVAAGAFGTWQHSSYAGVFVFSVLFIFEILFIRE